MWTLTSSIFFRPAFLTLRHLEILRTVWKWYFKFLVELLRKMRKPWVAEIKKDLESRKLSLRWSHSCPWGTCHHCVPRALGLHSHVGTRERASVRTKWEIETKTPATSRTLKETDLQWNGRSRKIYLPVTGENKERFVCFHLSLGSTWKVRKVF